jgi:putative ABC transport system permease protein
MSMHSSLVLAVLCNSLFFVVERTERILRPSGMNELDTFVISSLGLAPGFHVGNSSVSDLRLLNNSPGVVAATTINSVPMGGGRWGTGVDTVPIDERSTRLAQDAAVYFVNESGLEALDARLTQGRNFDAEEVLDFDPVNTITVKSVLVTEALATKLYPHGSALNMPLYGLGKQTQFATIVGVVGRLQQPWTLSRSVEQSILVPMRFSDRDGATYFIRAKPGQRDRVMKEVETSLQESNRHRLLQDLKSIESIRKKAYQRDSAMVVVLLVLSTGILLIGGLGIAGSVNFSVSRRVRQIGTLRALGARRTDILRYILLENAVVVAISVGPAIALSYLLSAGLVNYGLQAPLPWSYPMVAIAIVFVLGQLASLGPAVRVANVPPAVSTRGNFR